MKQTGTFHVYEIKNSQRVVSPIPNAFIYFVQDSSIKLTVKTDDKGKYSFDLPLGEYTVVSSSEGGIERLLANGSKFILNAQSKVTAFEEWVNAPSADVDTALLKRFKELAKIAEDAAKEANEVLAQLEGNSIGDGKWMREGAYGVGGVRLGEEGYTKVPMSSGIFNTGRQSLTASPQFISQEESHAPRENQLYGGIAIPRSLRPCEFGVSGVGNTATFHYRGFTSPQSLVSNWHQVYSDKNTRTDKNNVLHGGTSTPLTTLNTSDMVQDIVNREDVTVTSGAVFRGLAKKWDIQETVGDGKILREGVAGLGSFPSKLKILPSFGGVGGNPTDGNGFYSWGELPSVGYGRGIALENDGTLLNVSFGLTTPHISIYSYHPSYSYKVDLLHSKNTTVDSNGFLKKASPIIKLFDDRIETNGQFQEEPVFEKLGVGTYKISNTLGLAQNGWTYEKPRGGDGNPYFRVLVKKTEDGCIISVHDEYDSIEEATITDIDGNTRKINKVVKVLSQARDIKPHERWIDLRFHEEPYEETEPTEVVQ